MFSTSPRMPDRQKRGAGCALAVVSRSAVPGDVDLHPVPAENPPQRRLRHPQRLDPARRKRLRLRVQQPVPEPDAVRGNGGGEVVALVEGTPVRGDQAERRRDQVQEETAVLRHGGQHHGGHARQPPRRRSARSAAANRSGATAGRAGRLFRRLRRGLLRDARVRLQLPPRGPGWWPAAAVHRPSGGTRAAPPIRPASATSNLSSASPKILASSGCTMSMAWTRSSRAWRCCLNRKPVLTRT